MNNVTNPSKTMVLVGALDITIKAMMRAENNEASPT